MRCFLKYGIDFVSENELWINFTKRLRRLCLGYIVQSVAVRLKIFSTDTFQVATFQLRKICDENDR